jgi:hypothetical protein
MHSTPDLTIRVPHLTSFAIRQKLGNVIAKFASDHLRQ